ncbi:hypothetical protein [Neisseria dumasiana]|uniref:Uncharacterized protein n=1 Tax=Neisseria dumasiana TaxID=1931275 RepID=A0A1X3DKE4_9NEIS|nr:hypothetical protein [Neisseria dumasiana]OSI24659.1 hypothetical protein BV912_02050 [Neisseria dumasiana]
MKNMRIEISVEYQKACARLDGVLMRWIAVSQDMQVLTDLALPVVSAVIVPGMRDGGQPEITLVVDGREQEAAAWRVLGEFKEACGWVELQALSQSVGSGSMASVELFQPLENRRLCVNVREV